MNMHIIFTDGSSRGNPGPGGWGALIISPNFVAELGGSDPLTTNNAMELMAAIEGLRFLAKTSDKIVIFCDSRYVISGITSWVKKWRANGWVTTKKEPVENKNLWEKLYSLSLGKDIEWHYVPGHRGVLGNEIVDHIATSFADSLVPRLFRGTRADYEIEKNISTEGLTDRKNLAETRERKEVSYIALVGGKKKNFKTWEECKAAVTGVTGARYKKVFSEEEAERVFREWENV